METMRIEDVEEAELRAWAEAGIIDHARYVEEIERRKQEAAVQKRGPYLKVDNS